MKTTSPQPVAAVSLLGETAELSQWLTFWVRVWPWLSTVLVLLAAGGSFLSWRWGWLSRAEALHVGSLLVLAALLAGLVLQWGLVWLKERTDRLVFDLAQDRERVAAAQALEERVQAIMARLQEATRPTDLAQVTLSALARYLPVHQGLFCLWDDDSTLLRAAARYGGEGSDVNEVVTRVPRLGSLLEACARERRMVRLDAPGPGFVRVGSGLGDAAPAAVVLYPVQHSGKLFAVLELATLKAFDEGAVALLRALEPVIAMRLDILQRAERLEQLLEETRAQEAHRRLILDSVGDGIWGMDLHGCATFINRAALHLLGYDDESEVLGRNMHELVHDRRADGSHYPATECPMEAATRDHQPRHVVDEVLWRKDGRPLAVDYVTTVLIKDGAAEGVAVAFRDVTRERDEARQLEQVRAQVEHARLTSTALLAHISREARSALNTVVGLSHVLLRSVHDTQQDRGLRQVLGAGQSLLRHVNDMVDIVQLESGVFSLAHERFALRAALRRVLDDVRERAALRGLEWRLEVAAEVPDALLGDGQRLATVLACYCDQALALASGGPLQLAVCVEVGGETDEVVLRFEVGFGNDRPGGSDPSRLFDPHAALDWQTVREADGTGLGLAVARSLVYMMGGDVGLDGPVDGRSTIWFTAALACSADRADLPQAAPSADAGDAVAQTTWAGRRLLVVDDAPVDREVARVLLQATGAAVDVAAGGQQALQMLSGNPYDLVFMDIRMPDLDGTATTQRLRADPRWANLPVIALTASVMPEDVRRYHAVGMNDVLPKPIEPEALTGLLARWLPAKAPSTVPPEGAS